ncbi:class Ib ribonucleoside-diphosphate reductase assembly flavoprotein NrdI [Photobacterium jeanii]|uniref:class Ib ribonucleoside-diphosphate reductase assembly flavoprotein NrdI n=1 Tax=Photobacterium jeanii TaxID=858640 RepID=UPI00082A03C6|nr:class Ib ribonucleoside-diphosphate reductase assembly flavoprotein NrdI [Photobacterium jeanii]PST90276.1 class Ib ribonucleoside-diphosphate reductase assembly flavoprotein NrdI [Photobacterium jeanii]
MIVYYSSSSGNTHRFVEQLQMPAIRLPEPPVGELSIINQPFILICPTYADGKGIGAVPKAVIHAINNTKVRQQIRGVIASGNRNFGHLFAQAGDIIASKCHVPILYRFELSGTASDVATVRRGITQFWHHQRQTEPQNSAPSQSKQIQTPPLQEPLTTHPERDLSLP